MTFSLCGIKFDEVNHVWPKVEGMVQSALVHSDGKYKLFDIHEALILRNMQLWIVVDNDDKIYSTVITQIFQYPRKKVLFIVLVAGTKFNEWSSLVTHLIDFAKAYNCETIEGYGRDGWEVSSKHLGFTKIHTVYRLSLWGDKHEKDMDENSHPAQP